MDRFARLVLLCLAALVLFGVSPVFAYGDVQPTIQTTYTCTGAKGQATASSMSAACNAVLSDSKVYSAGQYDERQQSFYLGQCSEENMSCLVWSRSFYPNCTGCNGGADANQLSGAYPVSKADRPLCPDNSSEVAGGGSCSCNAGFAKNSSGSGCYQYTCPPSGSYSAVTQPDQKVPNAGDTVCTGGCNYKPTSWKVGQDGQIWATWPFKSSGSFCQGSSDPNKPGISTGEQNSSNPAPVPCGQNQCPGMVNGVAVCVPCKGTQEQGPSTSASGPSSGASAPGSSSTTTQCDGVNCTTTTVTRDGNGNIIGQVDKTENQESFCTENPQSSLCKQSSFGGACAATTCEGDAVMCAIAADQYKRNCEWFDDPAAAQLATVGNAALTGQDRPPGHPGNDSSAQSVSFASVIDQTDRLGAGCPADVAVSVSGQSLSIPFSSMCGNLQLVGNLMVGFCMFVAALIVFRG